MSTHNYVVINKIGYYIPRLKVGQSKSFGMCDDILAVAIERTSTNYYMCYAVSKYGVICTVVK